VTTDLYPKVRRAAVGGGSIVGIAKGAGMIEPNMATMLVYPAHRPGRAQGRCAPDAPGGGRRPTFNSISIDSDTSTSDTVALRLLGRVPCPDPGAFERALPPSAGTSRRTSSATARACAT
jgi:glutamate N-acetyltransferase/amino-acid N-acetyltransferase